MSLLRRLALMLVAFVASAAAVVLLLIALTSPPGQAFDPVMIEYAFIAFVLMAVLTFFPALLVVAVAEWKRQRGWLYFSAAGGLIALALMTLLGFVPGLDHPGSAAGPGLFFSGFLIVGGFVAGLVYWLIAGRTSGALRDAWPTRGVA